MDITKGSNIKMKEEIRKQAKNCTHLDIIIAEEYLENWRADCAKVVIENPQSNTRAEQFLVKILNLIIMELNEIINAKTTKNLSL